MATAATPASSLPPLAARQRTSSHSRTRSGIIPSRPTTPLRPPSRTSLRASQSTPSGNVGGLLDQDDPLACLEPSFAELSDSMADLEANMMHLQLLNESMARFSENFAAFLYGMNMSAFCVDFPEAPIPQSFARYKDAPSQLAHSPFRDRGMMNAGAASQESDATFLTTDTSFVENPPTSVRPSSKFSAPPGSAASSRQSVVQGRGGMTRGRAGSALGRGAGGRGSATGEARGGSGIGRGAARGRGILRGQ